MLCWMLMLHEDIEKAVKLLGLSEPFSREDLDRKKQELLVTWHPHRYASLTNNPKKYMQMYKQGETMTKEIHLAYELLVTKLSGEKDR
jgi:preprotein translocase subunit Sec63